MTSSQVLELDLSAVQFEDLSDEMARTIQGGTGDSSTIPVENFAPVSQSTAEGLRLVADFFDGFADIELRVDIPYWTGLEMKDFFPVAKLKERYGIGKQADINRRKHLGIVPQKIDGVYVISKEQLGMLDGLDEFLKSTPKAKMTDFPVESTGTNVPTERTVIDAILVDDNESSLVHQQEEEEPPTDLVPLVETIAHSISPPNPIAHWEKLQWLVDNEIIISTAEVQALVGTKPQGNKWTRGSFTFEKAGKLGTQSGWIVSR